MILFDSARQPEHPAGALSVSKKCFTHFFEDLHSRTGRSAITGASPALATLGKCKHLLSLVGASASLMQAALP
ncbi:MAG: hypothetical protein IJO39_12560, partial [Clostridia bacterium]|nr:hypothetical protein [Clostridia bacterium]